MRKKVIIMGYLALFITAALFGTESSAITHHEESMSQNAPLSNDQLLHIQGEIFDQIRAIEPKLMLIRESSDTLAQKWQKLLQLILPAQLEVIKRYDLGENQAGLSRFNEEYIRGSSTCTILLDLNKQKWLFIFEKAFDVTEFEEISLMEAQSLIADIAEAMTSESFLKQIDLVTAGLEPDASLVERRQAVLGLLFPVHMAVMAKHGFEGERGYIQAQRAIMDYYHDPLIAQRAVYAQTVLFRRAGLI